MPLEKFVRAKQAEVEALREASRNGLSCPVWPGSRPSFSGALRQGGKTAPLAIIAEYKRSSPSRGLICDRLEVEEVAAQYHVNGASAISILTEEIFFGGSMDFLLRAASEGLYAGARPPLLRKDFIFDMLQIRHTAASPASAVLLIVRLTPDPAALLDLREEAGRFGMEAVVEVFDERDLEIARESGASIIQVNARDLASLAVDRNACLGLARRNPPGRGEIWIAASGISSPAHLLEAADAGFSAALVGSYLMEKDCPGQALAALVQGCAHCAGDLRCS